MTCIFIPKSDCAAIDNAVANMNEMVKIAFAIELIWLDKWTSSFKMTICSKNTPDIYHCKGVVSPQIYLPQPQSDLPHAFFVENALRLRHIAFTEKTTASTIIAITMRYWRLIQILRLCRLDK